MRSLESSILFHSYNTRYLGSSKIINELFHEFTFHKRGKTTLTFPIHRIRWDVWVSLDLRRNISIWQSSLHFYQPEKREMYKVILMCNNTAEYFLRNNSWNCIKQANICSPLLIMPKKYWFIRQNYDCIRHSFINNTAFIIQYCFNRFTANRNCTQRRFLIR